MFKGLKLSVLIFSFHLQSCEIYFISIEVKNFVKQNLIKTENRIKNIKKFQKI